MRYSKIRSNEKIESLFTSLLKKGLTANLLKKGLIENEITFGFETLSPNLIGVINRRNGFGSAVSGQQFIH
ncbi:hypothetical protein ASJ81_18270 [Methanosarcina spelaei]|uniref:Uncharacterized protein n=1 Tax=Methanosarcina spelaei TaxID=1036679 RepID=A0A2A2HVD7_9EURY|nr:hypothetical protein ASJ81_18270 [Methanosarcina spelaei]